MLATSAVLALATAVGAACQGGQDLQVRCQPGEETTSLMAQAQTTTLAAQTTPGTTAGWVALPGPTAYGTIYTPAPPPETISLPAALLQLCGEGYKLQRYRADEGRAVVSTYQAPGWRDVDLAQPHDGDYRCSLKEKSQAQVPARQTPALPIVPLQQPACPTCLGGLTPYDQLGHEFPRNPAPGTRYKAPSGSWYVFAWGKWQPLAPPLQGKAVAPQDRPSK